MKTIKLITITLLSILIQSCYIKPIPMYQYPAPTYNPYSIPTYRDNDSYYRTPRNNNYPNDNYNYRDNDDSYYPYNYPPVRNYRSRRPSEYDVSR